MKFRTRLSTKGQIVLPKALRQARRWKAGTEFVIEEEAEALRLIPADKKAANWESLIGYLKYRGPTKTIAQMDAGVMAEARKHK